MSQWRNSRQPVLLLRYDGYSITNNFPYAYGYTQAYSYTHTHGYAQAYKSSYYHPESNNGSLH